MFRIEMTSFSLIIGFKKIPNPKYCCKYFLCSFKKKTLKKSFSETQTGHIQSGPILTELCESEPQFGTITTRQ